MASLHGKSHRKPKKKLRRPVSELERDSFTGKLQIEAMSFDADTAMASQARARVRRRVTFERDGTRIHKLAKDRAGVERPSDVYGSGNGWDADMSSAFDEDFGPGFDDGDGQFWNRDDEELHREPEDLRDSSFVPFDSDAEDSDKNTMNERNHSQKVNGVFIS